MSHLRLILSLLCALLLVSCAGSTTSTHQARPAPRAVIATTGGAPGCVRSQLRLSWASTNGAPGHLEAIFALRNVSTRSCAVVGYPSVQLLDAHGQALPIAARHGHGFFPDTRRAVSIVTVSPGQVAHFSVSFVVNNEYTHRKACVPASRLAASMPPAADHVLRISLAGAGRPRLAPCSALVVSPIYA